MNIEQVKPVETYEEMRAELFRLERHDPLVRRVADMANFNGLSAEDRYTLLAYHALKDRQRLLQSQLELLMVTPTASGEILIKSSGEILDVIAARHNGQ